MQKPGPKIEPGVEGLKRRELNLDDTTVQMLQALGGGNASKGARHAARVAYRIFQATPDPEPQSGE